jgi:hypothetical protein
MDQPTDSLPIFNIHTRLESCFQRMERILATLEQNPDPRIQLAAAAEMRKHVALAAQTLEIALRADALRDFEKSVLDALAEAGVRPRKKIMGLFDARADQTD